MSYGLCNAMLLHYTHGINQMNVVRWKDVVCTGLNIIGLGTVLPFVTVSKCVLCYF